MDSHITERYDEAAVNCLTGSYSFLAGIAGRPVAEQTVFERGRLPVPGGSGRVGIPEYIFPSRRPAHSA